MRVRATVKYVRSSSARLQKFQSCAKQENIDSKSLVCLDVETRKVGGAPDDEDWDKVASFLPFLEIFYDTTLSFSGLRCVTGNTFVEQIYDIGYTINHYVDDLQLSDGLRSMARQMKLKFDKYWANVNHLNVLMFISLVLDPRHKLRYAEWIIRRSYDPTNAFVLCQRIKVVLKKLFDFYASTHPSSTQKTSCTGNPNSKGQTQGGEGEVRKLKGTNLRKDYVNEIESIDTSETMIELDRYLGDNCARESDDFDILVWWSMQTNNYPILMRMARDVLAIPVSTVASESAFSTGGRILDSFRTSLTPRLVEALICTQDWVRASHYPIIIEENLLSLENMEEEMQDLTLEQPTIVIDETNEVLDTTHELS
ncbi:hypothetical protein GQ457_12G011290 [Hibiscus cannabinus]